MRYSILSKYRTELMGAAILWVMLFHMREAFSGLPVLRALATTGFGGVDVFLVLSSVGLVMSLGRREQSFSRFMGRRAWRILPAYFAVMVPFTLWGIARGTADWSTLLWNASLLYFWVRATGGFNWYVSGAMLFYALTPACLDGLRRSRRPLLRTAAGMLLGYAACRIMMADGYWWYIDVLYRIPIFFLGLQIGLWAAEDRRITPRHALFWAVWTALGAGYLAGVLTVPGEVFYLPLCHLFLFTTVPMCLTGCFLFEKLPLGWLRRFLRLAGRSSLEIYLLNVSFFCEEELFRNFFQSGPWSCLHCPLRFALNIALGVLLHRGVEALKAACQTKTQQ